MNARTRTAVLLVALAVALPASALAATPSADLLRCQKKIETQARAFAKLVVKKITRCSEKIDACKLASEIDGDDLMSCVSAASPLCATADGVLDTNRTRRKAAIDNTCAAIPLTDIEPFIGSLGFVNVAATCMTASTTGLTDCLLDTMRCNAERDVFRSDPRAQDSLTTAGVAASFPCTAP